MNSVIANVVFHLILSTACVTLLAYWIHVGPEQARCLGIPIVAGGL